MSGSILARRAASFVAVLYALVALVPVVIGALMMRGAPEPTVGCALGLAGAFVGPALLGMVLLAIDARVRAGDSAAP